MSLVNTRGLDNWNNRSYYLALDRSKYIRWRPNVWKAIKFDYVDVDSDDEDEEEESCLV